jgi:two-component system chemotaxis sensor kinase CheA
MSDMNFGHLLPFYLDETDEQVVALNDALLQLEQDQTDASALAVAFRIVHTIKGSSAALGFVQVNALTHHLESFFDILRSGRCTLDRQSLDLFFRCLDELRNYHQRLRESGESDVDFGDLVSLVEQNLKRVRAAETESVRSPQDTPDVRFASEPRDDSESSVIDTLEAFARTSQQERAAAIDVRSITIEDPESFVEVIARFDYDVPLPDMKARLIAKRLSTHGEILSADPPLDRLDEVADLTSIAFRLSTESSEEELRKSADMSGVASVDIRRVGRLASSASQPADLPANPEPQPIVAAGSPTTEPESPAEFANVPIADAEVGRADVEAPTDATVVQTSATVESKPVKPNDKPSTGAKRVGETVRVELDRLDHLMNLTGELVLSKSRFAQVSAALRENLANPSRRMQTAECLDRLTTIKSALHAITHGAATPDPAIHKIAEEFQRLSEEVESMTTELTRARKARATMEDLGEAVHQLTRVCDGLQKGVLDTRMIPIGPLFERFRRVIRDLSHATGKEIALKIKGESTELDKRVVDELADPLVHMVRNAGDHGLESPEERERLGKPRTGTISLSAAHTGDRVTIMVTDDGRGIDSERIRRKIVENGLVDASTAQRLSERELIAYIWHPGLSTAEKLTDISGRGVGMDIVRSRIEALNGTVDIRTQVGAGTTFVIRLPLTLAILPSLLVRVHEEIYAIAVDHIREIVEVSDDRIHMVRESRVIEIRDRLAPVISLDDLFVWGEGAHPAAVARSAPDEHGRLTRVVVLHSADEMIGLEVDELLGLQEVVLKSLDKNLGPVDGLSGASILGDGRVSLILDVDRLTDKAAEPKTKRFVSS